MIPISWFNTQGYCEYILYLRYVKKVPYKAPAVVVTGTTVHSTITFEHDKKAIALTDPLEVYLPKVMKGEAKPISIRNVLVESKKFGLRGEIDELHASIGEATIIDNKPGTWVPPNIQRQLFAYGLAFKDHFKWKPKIFCEVRSYDTDRTAWRHEFSTIDKKTIISYTQRINEILDEKRTPVPTKYPKKCERCEYCSVCPNSLVNKIGSQAKLFSD